MKYDLKAYYSKMGSKEERTNGRGSLNSSLGLRRLTVSGVKSVRIDLSRVDWF